MAQKRTLKRKSANQGLLITFEGIEGSGKSTQIQSVTAWLKELLPGREILLTREPGGTPLADQIREKLLTISSQIDAETELFLYEVARRDHVEEVLRPALRRKAIILCDRFIDSTVAYQGYGRGLSIARIMALNHIASGGLMPHLTFLLNLPVTEGLRRARSRSRAMDRIDLESKRFHERVRKGFLSLARKDKKRFKVLDARQSPEAIFEALRRHLGRALEKKI
jgi:dTMP kinase